MLQQEMMAVRGGDNWTCKVPVKSPPSTYTNTQPFYNPDVFCHPNNNVDQWSDTEEIKYDHNHS